MVPESKRNDATVKGGAGSIELAEQAQAVGPVTELEQKVAANPPTIRRDSTWRPRSMPGQSR